MTSTVPTRGDKSAAELAAEGWERRASYDEPRLSELVEMYRELGYDVYLKAFVPEDEQGCTECMAADPGRYTTIFTRK